MGFLSTLFRGDGWHELSDSDVERAKSNAKYWADQKKKAMDYVVAQGQAMEDEAIARGAFKMLSVAQARANAIDNQTSELARLERGNADKSAKSAITSYAKALRGKA